MVSKLRYLPYGVVIGVPAAALILFLVNKMRRQENKEPAAVLPVLIFGIYLAVILIITLLCREGGSGSGIDLKLFSTWGINRRNNAYVVENVLLFIPYGFLGCCAFEGLRRFLASTLLGAATSLGIECLQLATGRGFFQIDDILTNVCGMMLGFLGYRLFFRKKK